MDEREQRGGVPLGIFDALREGKFPTVHLAMRALRERDLLRPVDVPPEATCGPELQELMEAHSPSTVPKELRQEHAAYCCARDARIGAKAENARRLRTSLWAEQCLRHAGRDEHRLLRAFNMEAWGIQGLAPYDFAERERLVKDHA